MPKAPSSSLSTKAKAKTTVPTSPRPRASTASPFLQSIKEKIASKLLTAYVLACGKRASQLVQLDLTTTRGLFLEWVNFIRCESEDPALSNWRINSGQYDLRLGEYSIEVTAKTLHEAWVLFMVRVEEVGECPDCGVVTDVNNNGGGCTSCQIRAVFPPTECTICTLAKANIYHLKCGHRMCRPCAKRVAIDTDVEEDEGEVRQCPFCKVHYVLNQGLKEV